MFHSSLHLQRGSESVLQQTHLKLPAVRLARWGQMMTDRAGAKTGMRTCLPETLSLLRKYLRWQWAANKCQYCHICFVIPGYPFFCQNNSSQCWNRHAEEIWTWSSSVVEESKRKLFTCSLDFYLHHFPLWLSRQVTSSHGKIINVLPDKQAKTPLHWAAVTAKRSANHSTQDILYLSKVNTMFLTIYEQLWVRKHPAVATTIVGLKPKLTKTLAAMSCGGKLLIMVSITKTWFATLLKHVLYNNKYAAPSRDGGLRKCRPRHIFFSCWIWYRVQPACQAAVVCTVSPAGEDS